VQETIKIILTDYFVVIDTYLNNNDNRCGKYVYYNQDKVKGKQATSQEAHIHTF